MNVKIPIEEHPAFTAWSKLKPRGPPPKAIKLRAIDRARFYSTIYCLQGVGVGGSDVIAKNSKRQSMLIERRIYQEILPTLPITRLHCYGFIEDKETNSFWIFLEDAGGENYKESLFLHRTLASRWLGILHGATGKMDLAETLPPVGTDNYLSCLNSTRQNILDNINNPSLRSDDVLLLESIIGHCNAIETFWDDIECFCAQIPPCLVHGDFIQKNARVRIDETGPSIFVFDWHSAGWGLPAEDVAGLDIYIYWKKIREYQPDVYKDILIIKKLKGRGMIFRYLDWIHGASFGLAYEWVEKTIQDLKTYEDSLVHARRLAGV